MSSELAIKVENLNKVYPVFKKPQDRLKQFLALGRKKFFHEFSALKNIDFEVKRGETVGIVGCNGSGKSTLLQIICGIFPPSSGSVSVNGRISALLELGAGFNPEFTGKENIFLNAAILGLSREETQKKYHSIIKFSGLLEEKIEQPVKTYSSGMYVRLAFAVAASSDPDILIVDEALSVGDEAFQRKCFARINQIKENGGTVLFVSHSAASIIDLCDRAILLDQGELILSGEPKEVIQNYHKLIFAADDKKSRVRKEIKSGQPVAKAALKDRALPGAEKIINIAEFDGKMLPESTVSYEQRGAEIYRVQLLNSEGREVNLLKRGERYSFNYKIKFHEDAHDVKAGMLIKTITGVELGGASTSIRSAAIKKVGKRSILNISFSFTALLLPGTYFFNTGCTGLEGGERVFLHRITDAYMFKILPEDALKETGMVDFQIESAVSHEDIRESASA